MFSILSSFKIMVVNCLMSFNDGHSDEDLVYILRELPNLRQKWWATCFFETIDRPRPENQRPRILLKQPTRIKKKIMAPIDPLQLLRALSPLLASDGGIRSVEEVARLSSLMKKFSRKLVSKCVYVNVLRASNADAIEEFLVRGGWETIHTWLLETKNAENHSFLVELLKLYKILPMTVERLKENNSAKIIKTLSKSNHEDIKILASDVVESWVKLVKGDNATTEKEVKVVKATDKDTKLGKKRKRKEKDDKKDGKHEKERAEKDGSKEKKEVKEEKREKKANKEVKSPNKSTKENNKVGIKEDELEDVKLPDYIRNPEPKPVPKAERKSTVKTYQAKFRSIGLEEAAPLPKPASKKASTEKLAKISLKRIGSPLIKDFNLSIKRPKPPNLILPKTEVEKSSMPDSPSTALQKIDLERREIKLIAPRPKPMHVLTESAGFMDALVAGPAVPIRKKKKNAAVKSPTPTTPPSPVAATPKLQFYKDTLETQEENGGSEAKAKESNESTTESDEIMEISDVEAVGEKEKYEKPNRLSIEMKDEDNNSSAPEANSLVAAKKPKKRKTVSWAEESNLKEVFYFEMDETERVNVNNLKNFGDLSTLERLKERQAVESARHMMRDTMEERMGWIGLMPIDLPPPLVLPGCNSTERGVQKAREESVLQEIFFSKESLPDAPHEADPEVAEPEDPKNIPLEDENNPDAVVDYSMMEQPVLITSLPPALSNLVMSISSSGKPPLFGAPPDFPMENPEMPMMNNDPQLGHPNFNAHGVMGPNQGYCNTGFDHMGGGGFPPQDFNSNPGHDFGGPPPMDYYDGGCGPCGPGPGPGPGPMMQHNGPMMNRGHNGPMRGGRGFHGNHRGRGNMMGPHMRGMSNNRGRGGHGGQRGRMRTQTCRHFMSGSCKFDESCKFLHPGVNGPPL